MDSTHAAGYVAMTGHLVNLNRYEEALDYARQAVDLCPASARVYQNLAFALFRYGLFREALVEYEKAQRLSPKDPLLAEQINQQGACYFFLGEFESALARANRSIVLQDDYMWPHLFKILSLAQLGRTRDAQQALAIFGQSVPDFSEDQLNEIDPALGKVFIDGLHQLGWEGRSSFPGVLPVIVVIYKRVTEPASCKGVIGINFQGLFQRPDSKRIYLRWYPFHNGYV